jgi:hypothetical protein
VEDGYGKHGGHVTLPEFEADVEAEEQDVHDGALCGAKYPLAVPVLVPVPAIKYAPCICCK